MAGGLRCPDGGLRCPAAAAICPGCAGIRGELPVVPGCVREGPVVPGMRGSGGAVVVKKRACVRNLTKNAQS